MQLKGRKGAISKKENKIMKSWNEYFVELLKDDGQIYITEMEERGSEDREKRVQHPK